MTDTEPDDPLDPLDLADPGSPVGEGGFTPEGPDEGLVASPAGPPGPGEKDGPISRADAITRSESWVAEAVPYAQTGTHKNRFGSYRPDCSGFVSMCWNLSGSLTTFSLPDLMVDIDRADLRPGDALWRRSDGEGHIALFLRWADRAHTTAIVREEWDFGQVAEERYWERSYFLSLSPKRYKRITDGPAAKQGPLTDGTLVQHQHGPVAILVGGARIPLRSQAEVAAVGAAGHPVRSLDRKDWLALPSVPDDGTLISGAPALPVAVVVAGVRVNFRSAAEITDTGYGGRPVQKVPARTFTAMSARIPDGTLVSAPGLPAAVIVGGARVNFRSAAEIAETGNAKERVTAIPARVLSGMTGAIADGTLVSGAGLPVAVIVGGARVNFHDGEEIAATGNGAKPVFKLPKRVLTALPTRIADGTLVSAPGLPVAVIVGGARINLASAGEVTDTGHGGEPVLRLPVRVFTDLATSIADGTLIREPGTGTVWRVTGGKRVQVADGLVGIHPAGAGPAGAGHPGGGDAQVVPVRVLDSIPLHG